MIDVIGVRFRSAGKIYYFAPGGEEFQTGDAVIVETARGVEFGQVAIAKKTVTDDEITKPLKTVIRKATESDRQNM